MTQQPPIQPTPVGALRFNTDSAKLEYFDGNQYVNITTDSPEQNTGGTRGIFWGYNTDDDEIDFVNISSTGNATDFGNLGTTKRTGRSTSSRVKGLLAGEELALHQISQMTLKRSLSLQQETHLILVLI